MICRYYCLDLLFLHRVLFVKQSMNANRFEKYKEFDNVSCILFVKELTNTLSI